MTPQEIALFNYVQDKEFERMHHECPHKLLANPQGCAAAIAATAMDAVTRLRISNRKTLYTKPCPPK